MDPFIGCRTKQDHIAVLLRSVRDQQDKLRIGMLAMALTIRQIKDLYCALCASYREGMDYGLSTRAA